MTFALGAVLCLLLLAPQASVAAKDKWTKVRSKNFVLVGNASEKEIRKVATRLEQFRDVFSRLLQKTKFNSSTPTTVVVFKDFGSYRKYAPPNTAGYFQPGQDVNYIALSAVMDEANDPFTIIFHETVHLIVKNNVRNMPLWFNEGLAEYYSTFEIQDDERKVRLGKVISHHVFELRQRKMIPLRTLFEVDHDSPLYNESNKQSVFYAQSWALVHYMLLNPQRQPQLTHFLKLLLMGKTPGEAFPVAFQTDYATIEKELKEYVKRDSYPQQIATFERKLEFDLEMQATPLSEAEGEFYLGDLLNHRGHLDEAEKHLKKAIALDPQLAIANASLGMLEMRRENYAAAKRYLESAVTANTGNYLVHYYYAYVLSREAQDEEGGVTEFTPELASKMRAQLKKAIELAPDFPEPYRLLAFVNLVNGEELDDSVALLQRAMALLPGEQEFGYLLAQIHLRRQDFKAARELLEPIAASSATESILRQRVQSLLRSLQRLDRQVAGDEASDEPHAEVGPRTADEVLMMAFERLVHKQKEGELRVRGQLLRIDCNSRDPLLIIQFEGRQLKLKTGELQEVQFVSFVQESSSQIGCGQRTPADEVVVTYAPAKDAKAKHDGQAVSVAFVPKTFKLKSSGGNSGQ